MKKQGSVRPNEFSFNSFFRVTLRSLRLFIKKKPVTEYYYPIPAATYLHKFFRFGIRHPLTLLSQNSHW